MKTNTLINKIVLLSMIILFSFGIFSCSNKSDPIIDKDKEEPELPADSSLFYKVIRVSNIKVSVNDNNYTGATDNTLYSIEQNALVENKYRQTRRWDLAFGNIQNSFLSGNNGNDPENLGFKSSAIGGITIVEKAFDEVIDIPDEKSFLTKKEIIGPDINGDHAIGDLGWYLYDFYGSKVRDGKPADAHIAYPLSEPLKLKNGKIVAPRTVILRTASGNYVKFKMISCYKDQLKAEQWNKNSEKVYMTFDFVMVPKSSKKFIIK